MVCLEITNLDRSMATLTVVRAHAAVRLVCREATAGKVRQKLSLRVSLVAEPTFDESGRADCSSMADEVDVIRLVPTCAGLERVSQALMPSQITLAALIARFTVPVLLFLASPGHEVAFWAGPVVAKAMPLVQR